MTPAVGPLQPEHSGGSVYLFPGDGSFVPGALTAIADSAVVADTLLQADRACAGHGVEPVSGLLTDPHGPTARELLRAGHYDLVHIATMTAALARFRRLAPPAPAPGDTVLGHSLGEATALVAAGALTLGGGVDILCAVNRALRGWPPAAGAMLAVGAPEARVRQTIGAAALRSIRLAADNGPGQSTWVGPEEELAALAAAARAHGWRTAQPATAWPYHQPALRHARRHVSKPPGRFPPRSPGPASTAPTAPASSPPADEIRATATCYLTHPVRFADALRTLLLESPEAFIDCGTRGTLSALLSTVRKEVRP
ncbi:acyltransferase domain-containing protein [Kitasatospora sp. NPDC059463]|uniref:acyltransferase domain-containing protein n=1 Tax=unclassified Kitasatospora TaxID=2633591 RepID=UPI00369D54E1